MRLGPLTLLALALALSACGSGGDKTTARGGPAGKVGVLLPDSSTDPRWATLDRPALQRAFRAEGVPVEIASAPAGAAQRRAASRLLAAGIRALVVANAQTTSDDGVGALARARRVPVVAYDRLPPGTGAGYYVSVDRVKAGKLLGQGLLRCLQDAGVKRPRIGEVNGEPADFAAVEFKQGYDGVLNPQYSVREAYKVSDRWLSGSDPAAQRRTARRMLRAAGARVDGVVAPSDAMAVEVAAQARRLGLSPAAIVGLGATLQGRRDVRAGTQCMTVTYPIAAEAAAAAQVAGALARGGKPSGDLLRRTTDDSGRKVPTVLIKPKAVTAKDL